MRWQKWRFRYALHPREGLVLYTVGYEDGGKVRPVMYRGSLSEMVVPYGDPTAGWFFRNSFDVGELGLGVDGQSAARRRGLPRELHRASTPWWPTAPANRASFRAPWRSTNAMAASPGSTTTTRAARASWCSPTGASRAITNTASTGFSTRTARWKCACGSPASWPPRAWPTARTTHTATWWRRNLAAPHHQHFFVFRLDMDVDGPPNRVMEMNSVAMPAGPANPYGGGFTMQETPLRTEREAQRQLNLASSRRWMVESATATNSLGHPTGYLLMPGENSRALRAARFVGAQTRRLPQRACLGDALSATPNAMPRGDYPNQSQGGDGLPKWTAANRADRRHATWCCGTSWGSPTIRAPKIGR